MAQKQLDEKEAELAKVQAEYDAAMSEKQVGRLILVPLSLFLNIMNTVFVSFDINSLPAFGDFCRLLITFANSLDPDQA